MAMLTAKQISSLGVVLLTRSLVLPMTAARIPGGEFSGSNGDTITVRVRQPRSANVQAARGTDVSANFSSINETPVDVTLAHLYDGVNLTDEESSLDLVNFGAQVLEPQVAAVATGAEDRLASAMNALAADAINVGTTGPAIDAAVSDAREALTVADVPASDRWLACSPDIISALLTVDKFVRADAMGDGRSTALRDATMGRIYGFTVVESNGLTAGTAVGYHRSGFAFANRVPVPPRGNEASATATEGGIGLRHILQYNPSTLTDQSVISTFAGASAVDVDRVFKLTKAAA